MKNLVACVLFAMVAGCVDAENTDAVPYESEDCTTEFAWSYCLDPVVESTDSDSPACDYARNVIVTWTDEDEIKHALWCVSHEEVCMTPCGERWWL